MRNAAAVSLTRSKPVSPSAPPVSAVPPVNICGVVVHLRAERADELRRAISALQGVEIHAQSETARLVVTAVDEGDALALDQIAAINRFPGVVSTSLVYHALDVAD